MSFIVGIWDHLLSGFSFDLQTRCSETIGGYLTNLYIPFCVLNTSCISSPINKLCLSIKSENITKLFTFYNMSGYPLKSGCHPDFSKAYMLFYIYLI